MAPMKMVDSPLEFIDDVLKTCPLLYISTLSGKKVNLSVYANYITIGYGKQILLESQWYKEKQGKELKDTLVNIRENGWAVLNIPFQNLLDKLYEIASPLPRNESEAEVFGIGIKYLNYKAKKFPVITKAPIAIIGELVNEIMPQELEEISLLALKPVKLFIDEAIPQKAMAIKKQVTKNGIYHFGNWQGDKIAIGTIKVKGLDKNTGLEVIASQTETRWYDRPIRVL